MNIYFTLVSIKMLVYNHHSREVIFIQVNIHAGEYLYDGRYS